MDYILGLVSKVPTILWVIIGAVFVVPMLWRAFKKGAKVLGYVAIGLALLFMFPSIGSSFMKEAQLTWDDETGTLTNRNGTSISMDDIIEKGTAVKDMANDAIQNAGDIIDILGGGTGNGAGTEKDDTNSSDVTGAPEDSDGGQIEDDMDAKVFILTQDMINDAIANGLDESELSLVLLSDDSVVTLESDKYYISVKGTKIELSVHTVEMLGILNSN